MELTVSQWWNTLSAVDPIIVINVSERVYLCEDIITCIIQYDCTCSLYSVLISTPKMNDIVQATSSLDVQCFKVRIDFTGCRSCNNVSQEHTLIYSCAWLWPVAFPDIEVCMLFSFALFMVNIHTYDTSTANSFNFSWTRSLHVSVASGIPWVRYIVVNVYVVQVCSFDVKYDSWS